MEEGFDSGELKAAKLFAEGLQSQGYRRSVSALTDYSREEAEEYRKEWEGEHDLTDEEESRIEAANEIGVDIDHITDLVDSEVEEVLNYFREELNPNEKVFKEKGDGETSGRDRKLILEKAFNEFSDPYQIFREINDEGEDNITQQTVQKYLGEIGFDRLHQSTIKSERADIAYRREEMSFSETIEFATLEGDNDGEEELRELAGVPYRVSPSLGRYVDKENISNKEAIQWLIDRPEEFSIEDITYFINDGLQRLEGDLSYEERRKNSEQAVVNEWEVQNLINELREFPEDINSEKEERLQIIYESL